jgi:hypothetical protein
MIAVLHVLACLAGGCAMRISPPADIAEPVSVFIADYGIHGSLLLPRDDGNVSEYAYGHYDWFALNRDRWYNAIPILCFGGKAALGMRVIPCPPTAESLRSRLVIEGLYELSVEQSAAGAMRRQLEQLYDRCRPVRGEIYNPKVDLTFVEHPRMYTVLRNCNAELAAWLEAIGCRVIGDTSQAKFIIEPPN